MKKLVKAIAAIILMTMVVFAAGCGKDDSSNNGSDIINNGGNNNGGGNNGGSINGHEYVDLGLPSGTLWATCNLGADDPEGYGDYFAWGETHPKDYYDWSTYQHCNGSYDQLTKYCNLSDYGYNGFTDNLTVLQPSDDAAAANWGNEWCIPTNEQWEELIEKTTNTAATQNGVQGRLFTGGNGNSVFLPFAGWYSEWDDGNLMDVGSTIYCWSSSLCADEPMGAWGFYSRRDLGTNDFSRASGLTVRPVRSSQSNQSYNISVLVNPSNGGYVSGAGTYQSGQSCTLTATPASNYVLVNWTENGNIVSSNTSYTFTVLDNRSLVVNFNYFGGEAIFKESFENGQGQFSIHNVTIPDELPQIWYYDVPYYCMHASGYSNISGQSYNTESWLVSPMINLPASNSISLQFDQAVRFDTSPYERLHVMVSTNFSGQVSQATWTELILDQWPEGTNWVFVTSKADLSSFANRSIVIAFKYTSNTSVSPAWEVKNVEVKANTD